MRTDPLFDAPAVEALRRASAILGEATSAAEEGDAAGSLDAIAAVRRARTDLLAAELELVRGARAGGATWHALAVAVGTTRQSITKRYRSRGVQ